MIGDPKVVIKVSLSQATIVRELADCGNYHDKLHLILYFLNGEQEGVIVLRDKEDKRNSKKGSVLKSLCDDLSKHFKVKIMDYHYPKKEEILSVEV